MGKQVDMKRWQGHLDAIERQGITVARYAREQGISRHTLYAARAMQRSGAAKGVTRKPTKAQPGAAGPTRTTNRFTAVKLIAGAGMPPLRTAARGQQPTAEQQPIAPMLRAWLPNGVEIELGCSGSDTALVRVMLNTLRAAP